MATKKKQSAETVVPEASTPPSVQLSALRTQYDLFVDSYSRACETGTVKDTDLVDVVTLLSVKARELEARRS